MLTLYVKTGCPFCAKVLRKIEELDIDAHINQKNIADEGVVDELVAHGGRRATPYLIDENDNGMYESDAIVAYLDTRFGAAEGAPDAAVTS